MRSLSSSLAFVWLACAEPPSVSPSPEDLVLAQEFGTTVAVDWAKPDVGQLGPFSTVPNYTQHRLQPRLGQVKADLLVFYKRDTDGGPVIALAQREVETNCAGGECSGQVLRSETRFSRLELLSVDLWLRSSPLNQWLTTYLTLPELLNDGDPTLVQLRVEAPETAHDTIRAMLAHQAVPDELVDLRVSRAFSAATN